MIAGVDVSIMPHNSVHFPIVHSNDHDAVVLSCVDDFAYRSKLNPAPVFDLVVTTNEHHDQFCTIAIDPL